jgi:hypothetical protein
VREVTQNRIQLRRMYLRLLYLVVERGSPAQMRECIASLTHCLGVAGCLPDAAAPVAAPAAGGAGAESAGADACVVGVEATGAAAAGADAASLHHASAHRLQPWAYGEGLCHARSSVRTRTWAAVYVVCGVGGVGWGGWVGGMGGGGEGGLAVHRAPVWPCGVDRAHLRSTAVRSAARRPLRAVAAVCRAPCVRGEVAVLVARGRPCTARLRWPGCNAFP